MTQDMDIDGILKALSDPKAGKNITGLMDLVDEANVFLGKLDKTMGLLDRMGVKPLLVRAAGQKLGVDVDTPLAAENRFEPASKTHEQVFNNLNAVPEDQLKNMEISERAEEPKKEIE